MRNACRANVFFAGSYILDVRARVPHGQRIDAANAVGSFARVLRPLVNLTPAAVLGLQ